MLQSLFQDESEGPPDTVIHLCILRPYYQWWRLFGELRWPQLWNQASSQQPGGQLLSYIEIHFRNRQCLVYCQQNDKRSKINNISRSKDSSERWRECARREVIAMVFIVCPSTCVQSPPDEPQKRKMGWAGRAEKKRPHSNLFHFSNFH